MKLFWKILLSFWLVAVTTIGVTVLVSRPLDDSEGSYAQRGPPPDRFVRLSIAIVSTFGIGFLLARALSARLERIRGAAEKLAAGDLTARVGSPPARRHDEIDVLGREFDRMAEALERSVEAQRQLVHDVSHELRAPLARLQVAAGLVRKHSGPEGQSALDRIDQEVEALAELYEELLSLARLEARPPGAASTAVRLDVLLENVGEDVSFSHEPRRACIEIEATEPLSVSGDARLLGRAFENVLRNALLHTPDETKVVVSIAEDGPHAVVTVRDQGPGVPEDQLERIFQPFVRIDDARSDERGGTGLGLAIVERCITAHGGTVRAHNLREGGLAVEMRIPRHDAKESS